MWFKSILNNLTHKTVDKEKYPNFIFFFKNNECYFEYNQKNGLFLCDYHKVWSIFESKYSINDQQKIRIFVKNQLEELLKLMNLKPYTVTTTNFY